MAKDETSPDETIDSTEIVQDEPKHEASKHVSAQSAHHHKHHVHHASEQQENTHSHKASAINVWMIASIVLFVVAALFLVLWLTKSGSAGVSEQKISADMKSFIDTNLLEPGYTATIDSVTPKNGVYEVIVSVQGQKITSYASKDGKIFFPSGMLIDGYKNPQAGGNGGAAAPVEIPKSDKPVVQVFVMSKCPYGVQAEQAFLPAAQAFGNDIDYQIKFIANQNADGTFNSLHGQPEVDEDLRQVCIMNQTPDKFFSYLKCQDDNYAAQKDLGTTWQACATSAGIDSAKVNTCATGQAGKDLLAANIKAANDNNIGSSPTVMINGVKYSGARTAQALQSAVCSAFNNQPASCANVVTGTAPTASGNCG